MEQSKEEQLAPSVYEEIGVPIDISRVINDARVISGVFSDFNENELSIISSIAKAYKIEKDQNLIYENEQAKFLCIVVSGLLEVVKKGIISEECRAIAEISEGMRIL